MWCLEGIGWKQNTICILIKGKNKLQKNTWQKEMKHCISVCQLDLEISYSKISCLWCGLLPIFKIRFKGKISLCVTLFPWHDGTIYSIYFLVQEKKLENLKGWSILFLQFIIVNQKIHVLKMLMMMKILTIKLSSSLNREVFQWPRDLKKTETWISGFAIFFP